MQLSADDYYPVFRYRLIGWPITIILILMISTIRFVLVLQANVQGSYQYISYFFMALMLLPFLLLNFQGRKKIGLKRVDNWKGVGWGVFFGIVSCSILFGTMYMFFDKTESNAFAYIARTYQGLPEDMDRQSRLIYFVIFGGISMFFSPLGEELFYRGLIHENLSVEVGETKASILDSLTFSLVHLSHFGWVYLNGAWQFLFWPSLIWMLGLFVSCLLFNMARKLSGSIVGAIAAHAFFNLTMTYFIFYHIMD